MNILAAHDELRRRTLRKVLLERVVAGHFALPPGGQVNRKAVLVAVAAYLKEEPTVRLSLEIRALAIAAGLKPTNLKGKLIYRRPKRV